MKKRRLEGAITVLAGLPGLAGILLLIKISNLPTAAFIVVTNSIFFRGLLGTMGGILLWRGRAWGYYLSLLSWAYMIAVSILTISSEAINDGAISAGLFVHEYETTLKLVLGTPICYILLRDIFESKNLFRASK